jgi:RNA polymerase sigma-70 factor (ECF subfamily)
MNAKVLQPTASRSSQPARAPSAEQHARAVWFRAATRPARQRDLLASLYAAHRTAVLAFARRLGATDVDAEDVCADVFVVALKRLDSFQGQSTPRTWLLGITRRVMSDRRRSASHRREVLVDACPDERADSDTEAQAMEAEGRAVLRLAVAALSPTQRAVVTGYHLDEAPMAAVAKRQRVPLQTAYARLYAGHAQLRAQLAVAS